MAAPLKILVAQADANDSLLLKHAFSKARLKASLHYVQDGQQAVAYLSQKLLAGKSADPFLPDLLLLDLNLPHVDGFAVLEWLKQQPPLNRMLVLVFSAPELPEELGRAYSLGADASFVKPRDLEGCLEVVYQIEQHWLRLNATPECGCESVWD
jgi:CheY-like chemotaxis protein